MSIAGAAAGRTGLSFLQGILDGTIAPAPIQATLGFELVSVGDGVVRFRMIPGEHLYNPMASVHGGVACVLLDSAMSSSVLTQLDETMAYTTVDLSVHLTRAIRADSGEIFAEGRVVHRGSRVATAEGKLLDARGRLLAHGTTTCLLVERASRER
jgi:uncharacterized protein (TIGR00369 family)